MIKILVTGSNGQLGQSLKAVSNQYHDFSFKFTDASSLNITDSTKVSDFFYANSFDYCINCAAYTAVDKAEDEKINAFSVNAEAVRYLAENCKKHDVILIHVSTDFVFDGEKVEPYLETDKPNPINVYGASKLLGEQYIQNIYNCFFIIRTSWVYSQYAHNFVKTILRLGKEKEELRIVSDQFGSPTYATDLAEFILFLIQENSDAFGVYHFSNSGGISWFDFAKAIIELSQSNADVHPIRSKDFQGKALRPKYSVMNTEKTQALLGTSLKKWNHSLSKCLETM